MTQAADFYLTGIPTADALLADDPNALLIGMVLDQQVPMEKAFTGPAVIAERMGGTFDVTAIAQLDPLSFTELCSRPPAVHRFPGAMATRIHAVCRELVERWDGDVVNLYKASTTGEELRQRLQALPGFGAQKAQIFVALLGKQHGVTPPGWREAAGEFGPPDIHHSVADIVDPESLLLVRATKRAVKEAAKVAASRKADATASQSSARSTAKPRRGARAAQE